MKKRFVKRIDKKKLHNKLTLRGIEDKLYKLSCERMGIDADREYYSHVVYKGMFEQLDDKYIHQFTPPPPLPVRPTPLIVK
jgi:hypothetical protein